MPTPYRKACDKCIKSKRRCDLAVPACSRCSLRSLDCHYGNAVAAPSGNGQQDTGLSSTPILHDESLAVSDPNFDSAASRQNFNIASEILNSDSPFPMPESNDWWDPVAVMEQLSVPDQLEINNTPQKKVLMGQKYQQRIIYATRRLKLLPNSFANNGGTFFIHPNLYDSGIPQTLGDTMALCALYSTKSSSNEEMVYRIVSQHAHRTVDGLDWLASPIDFLASAQALALIQLIRLFDGDIRQRSEAETIEPTFMSYIRSLQHKMQPIGDGWQNELMSQKNRVDGWENWLYAESVRRTVIFGNMLDGLYCFLKHGWDTSHDDFLHLSFFAQKAFWGASSKFQWEMALDENNACPLRFSSWDADIINIRVDDMEELGMLMTALMKGVDHCRYWIGPQKLEQFGLQT